MLVALLSSVAHCSQYTLYPFFPDRGISTELSGSERTTALGPLVAVPLMQALGVPVVYLRLLILPRLL